MTFDALLYIDGQWTAGSSQRYAPVDNPATGKIIGRHAMAEADDLDRALESAQRGYRKWSQVPAFERYKVLRRAADELRGASVSISRGLTLEQGKPLSESQLEVASAADIIDWLAEEGRRTYGRLIPARATGIRQAVIREPVGPVAAFSPWNFPIGQAVRKIAAALAAGCSIIIKGPEETPSSCVALVQAFERAGVPAGVLNLVFGEPAKISAHLIASSVIRKISFTGSTTVGKRLAELGGRHMKRMTMELGGHAPVLVFADADLPKAVQILAGGKFRNAGQICASPTRFLVEKTIYKEFCERFAGAARAIAVGDGLESGVQMGPLAAQRRVLAMQSLVGDAERRGAKVVVGGTKPSEAGHFFAPTVLTDVSSESDVMNTEPFGPIAPIMPFASIDAAIAEANRLAYGLAAYVWTSSAQRVAELSTALECGMISVNHAGLALAETPFGGVKDSGYGSEGGSEALDAYLTPKFITESLR